MKLLGSLLLLISTFFWTSQVEAAGGSCCLPGYNYDSVGKDCVKDLSVFDRKPILCVEEEICFTPDITDWTGVCTKEEDIGGPCCPGYPYFDDDQGACIDANGVPHPVECGADAYCYGGGSGSGTCLTGSQGQSGPIRTVCDAAGSYVGECLKCMGDPQDPLNPGKGGSWTALGCIEAANPSTFIQQLMSFGVGIAGGIAFLLIIVGGFQMMTASGNPEQLNAGKELIGSAITGLLLIVFSIFVLRVIGVDILALPDFE
jgi:hypothetical protein